MIENAYCRIAMCYPKREGNDLRTIIGKGEEKLCLNCKTVKPFSELKSCPHSAGDLPLLLHNNFQEKDIWHIWQKQNAVDWIPSLGIREPPQFREKISLSQQSQNFTYPNKRRRLTNINYVSKTCVLLSPENRKQM